MSKILITGASGFIGSFLVEEALKRGFDTWAAVRKGSSRRYLADERINFIELDFDDRNALKRSLETRHFDYVVHAAGVTKCLDKADFFRVNTQGTANLVEALIETTPGLKRFVFISSLSVCGPLREKQPYTEMTDDDEPRPNTLYGQSKLMAENFIGGKKGFPCVTLRLTGVYGPREKDYFLMAESIKKHVDFAVGYKPQDITFVFVSDVVQAAFLALDHGKDGAKYFISDGSTYSSRAFSDLICRELNCRHVLRIKAPLWVLRIVAFFGEHIGRITGRMSALNNDKYNILKQRNWRCDIGPARRELGFNPKVGLDEGVRITMQWYKDNNWL